MIFKNLRPRKPAKDWQWFQIHWNRPVIVDEIQKLLENLASDDVADEIVFETRTIEAKIVYLIATRANYASHLERSFQTFAPSATLINIEGQELNALRPDVRIARRLSLGNADLVLNTERTEIVTRSILTSMASIVEDETAVVQVMLGRRIRPFVVPSNLESASTTIVDRILWTPELNRISNEVLRELRAKHSNHGFQVDVRIGANAHQIMTRGKYILELIKNGFRAMEMLGSYIDFARDDGREIPRLNQLIRPRKWEFDVSSKEASGLMAIPYGEYEYPLISSVHPIKLKTHRFFKEDADGFAISNDPANRIKFGVSTENSLRHTLLLGPSGVGKSTAMLNMILTDIKRGHGVVVIDPKGDLTDDVLARMDPARKDDVVYIDPLADQVVGINPLASQGDPDYIADSMLTVLRDIFTKSWGVRIEDNLMGALLTIMRTAKRPSISMLIPTLLNPVYRRDMVEEAKKRDPQGLGSFWNEYEARTPKSQQESIASLLNKLRQLLYRKPLLRTIGQENPSFDLKDVFTKNKIVLVSLNKARLNETATKFLGSVILSQIWTLTQAQAEIPEHKRPIVKVYVDEVQDYLSLPISIADALSQARSYRVGFTLAHQYRRQIDGELLAGMDTNIANKVFFNLQSVDAKAIADSCDLLKPEDFRALKRYEVYIQTLCHGSPTWISATTLEKPKVINDVKEFKKYSLARYGRAVSEIDKETLEASFSNEDISQKLAKVKISSPLANDTETTESTYKKVNNQPEMAGVPDEK